MKIDRAHRPGVVDDDVELGEVARERRVQGFDFLHLAHIAAEGLEAGVLLLHLGKLLRIATGDDDHVAKLLQLPRQLQANTARAAGDEDRVAFHVHDCSFGFAGPAPAGIRSVRSISSFEV